VERCALRCAPLLTVGGMNLSTRIDQHLARHNRVPARWGTPPAGVGTSLEDVVAKVRRLDDGSDQTVEWLLRAEARSDPLATTVLVAALAPLSIARCRGRSELIDDFLTEIVLVAGAVDVADLQRSHRRHVAVILDRAWDVVRKPDRRPAPVVPVDPSTLHEQQVAGHDDGVLDRVALNEARAAVMRESAAHPNVVQAWNSVLQISQVTHRTPREKARYSYSLAVVRRYCPEPAAA
jgi:hypothetical protein